jgi:hypothetical protein
LENAALELLEPVVAEAVVADVARVLVGLKHASAAPAVLAAPVTPLDGGAGIGIDSNVVCVSSRWFPRLGRLGAPAPAAPSAPSGPSVGVGKGVGKPDCVVLPEPPLLEDGRVRCTWPKCTSTFSDHHGVRRHVRVTHLCEKPFVCDEDGCGKKFGHRQSLEYHVAAAHRSERPFKCVDTDCTYVFPKEAAMRAHVRRYVNVFAPPETTPNLQATPNLGKHAKALHV